MTIPRRKIIPRPKIILRRIKTIPGPIKIIPRRIKDVLKRLSMGVRMRIRIGPGHSRVRINQPGNQQIREA